VPVKLPEIDNFRVRLKRHCNVLSHKLIAIAFTNNGHIITFATNMSIRGRIDHTFTIHAEDNLIGKLVRVKARERFGKINVIIARKGQKGWLIAKPCSQCQEKLNNYGISEIYYTTNNSIIKRLR